jgi:hypothetical protein
MAAALGRHQGGPRTDAGAGAGAAVHGAGTVPLGSPTVLLSLLSLLLAVCFMHGASE